MKSVSRFLLSTLLILSTAPLDYGQQVNPATAVQQTPSRADAALNYSALEGTGSVATTLTLTPNGGEYIYIYQIDISNVVGAAAVTAAATSTITTTNISGSPLWVMASGASAGSTTAIIPVRFPTGLKSQTPGTAVTFVLPIPKINQGLHLNVAWRSAP